MKKKFLPILTASLVLWSTVIFFIPLTIFLGNRLELAPTLTEVLVQAGIITLLVIITWSLIIFLAPSKRHSLIISILLALALLLWLQSNIIGINYGVLDGQEINWADHRLYGVFNSLFWLTLLIIAVKYSNLISRHLSSIAVILLTIQTASLGVNLISSPPEPSFKQYIIDDSNKFSFSPEKNVIILVLDAFQTNYFDYVLKQHPEYANDLEGFTYFPNTTGGFPTTYPSIPLILTGQYYDNAKPIQDFIKDAYFTNSLPKFLKDNLFYCDMFPFARATVPHNPQIFDNLIPRNNRYLSLDKESLTELGYLTWFRSFPQVFKPVSLPSNLSKSGTDELNLNTDTHHSQDLVNFLRSMKESINANAAQPQFKFYHTLGLHKPLKINETLSYDQLSWTPQDYARAAQGGVEMLKEFITILKTTGVYDESMVVVVGDHGAGMPIDEAENNSSISQPIRSGALPLVLIKPFKTRSPLQTLRNAITLGDIFKTIATTLKPDDTTKVPGINAFDNDIPTDRERPFYFYEWAHAVWFTSQTYLPPMHKYVISGDSWNSSSWHDTREIHTNGTIIKAEQNYTLGTQIDFSTSESKKFRRIGWGSLESAGSWTIGKSATLELDNLPSDESLLLEIDVTPFTVAGKLPTQHIELFINNHTLGNLDLTAKGTHKMLIPSKYLKGKQDLVKLSISSPTSPKELGISGDDRELGVQVRTLTISPLTEYTFNEPINFTTKDFNASPWLDTGWTTPEKEGTWTIGTTTNVLLKTPSVAPKELVLEATLTPLLSPPRLTKQIVKVSVNGHNIGEWNVNKTDTYIVPIPTEAITNSDIIITFSIPTAKAPFLLDLNEDARQLGVRFSSLIIRDTATKPYAYGTTLKFTEKTTDNSYLVKGWSIPEEEFTWSKENETLISIPVIPSAKDLTFSAEIMPFLVAPNLLAQNVQIFINNALLTKWKIKNTGTFTVAIPKESSNEGKLEIKFVLPNATSPQKLHVSQDQRHLGIGLKSLVISQ